MPGDAPPPAIAPSSHRLASDSPQELLDLELAYKDAVVRRFSAEANPTNGAHLRQLLLDAIERTAQDHKVGEYEMNIRHADERSLITFASISA